MPTNLPELFKTVTVADVAVDRRGRVVIHNPELAAKLAESGSVAVDPSALEGNGICCGNTGCLSNELVRMLDRLSGGIR